MLHPELRSLAELAAKVLTANYQVLPPSPPLFVSGAQRRRGRRWRHGSSRLSALQQVRCPHSTCRGNGNPRSCGITFLASQRGSRGVAWS